MTPFESCTHISERVQLLAYHKPEREPSTKVLRPGEKTYSGLPTNRDSSPPSPTRCQPTRFIEKKHALILQVTDCSSILLQVIERFR